MITRIRDRWHTWRVERTTRRLAAEHSRRDRWCARLPPVSDRWLSQHCYSSGTTGEEQHGPHDAP